MKSSAYPPAPHPTPLPLYTMPPILQQNPPSMIFQKLQPTLLSHYVWGGTKNFEESIINILKKTFKISQEEFENLKYLCLHIQQKQDCIYLDQHMYIDELKEVQICKDRKMSKKSPLNNYTQQKLSRKGV